MLLHTIEAPKVSLGRRQMKGKGWCISQRGSRMEWKREGEGKGRGLLLIVYLVCFPECPLLGWNIIITC